MDKLKQTDPDELLAQGTCGIVINKSVVGTGWLLSPEHVVTAGHLIANRASTTLEVKFSDGEPREVTRYAIAYDPERGEDFCILKLQKPLVARQPLPVSVHKSASGEFRLQGYGKTLVDRSGGKGIILSATFAPKDHESNRLFLLRSPELGEGGYSGGAVYSDSLSRVIAIQIETTAGATKAHNQTVLAMPMYRIAEKCPELFEQLGITRDASAMSYDYEIFLSYHRKENINTWVERIFLPELVMWLDEELDQGEPLIFWNQESSRRSWSPMYSESLRKSCCLIPVLTPSYFRAPECKAEWETFARRESSAGLPLVFPILWHGEAFMDEQVRLRCRDFQKYAFSGEAIKKMEVYIEFQREMKTFSSNLAKSLAQIPDFQANWPLVHPSEFEGVAKKAIRIRRPIL